MTHPVNQKNITHTISDCQVQERVQETIQSRFPDVTINGYRYSENDIWKVLLYASANRLSIKGACDQLKNAPTYNWMYTELKNSLFEPHDLESMESRLNSSLHAAIPKGLKKRAQKAAIDLVLLPYYGDETTDGIYRSEAKRSTTKFYCFASAYIIKKNKRCTLHFTIVKPEDTLLEILNRILTEISDLGICLKRLYLDREFARVDILKYLNKKPFVSVIALPKKGKRLKEFSSAKASTKTFYTMRSQKYGTLCFPLWIVCRYHKGRAHRHGIKTLLFAVLGACRSSEIHIADEYRKRFGIEASYRILNQARAQTTSQNLKLRLLLVAISFIQSNLWAYLKWTLILSARRKGRKMIVFTYDRFRSLITTGIIKNYGIVDVLKL
jgi:putative transposase